MEADKEFPRSWPFGNLKTLNWVGPALLFLVLVIGPFLYATVDFVMFTSGNFFLYSFVTWICYLLGLQKKALQFGSGYLFIPFALMDLIICAIGTLCFGISSLICLIAMFHGFGYRFSVAFTYFLATILSVISAGSYGYYAILIYKECPNGKLRNLLGMYVDGISLKTVDATYPTDQQSRPPI